MIRLKSILSDFNVIEGWSKDPSLKEYFRRYAPSFMWGSEDQVRQAHATSYFIMEEDTHVGLICTANYNANAMQVEVGILVDSKLAKNPGIVAVQAMKQLVEYFFTSTHVNKIYCLVLPHRDRLGMLLKKFNFKHEGRLRDNIFWEGRFHDEDLYALTKKDYQQMEGK